MNEIGVEVGLGQIVEQLERLNENLKLTQDTRLREALKITSLMGIACELELLRLTLVALVPESEVEDLAEAVKDVQKSQSGKLKEAVACLQNSTRCTPSSPEE